jgi:hypothetical protein
LLGDDGRHFQSLDNFAFPAANYFPEPAIHDTECGLMCGGLFFRDFMLILYVQTKCLLLYLRMFVIITNSGIIRIADSLVVHSLPMHPSTPRIQTTHTQQSPASSWVGCRSPFCKAHGLVVRQQAQHQQKTLCLVRSAIRRMI